MLEPSTTTSKESAGENIQLMKLPEEENIVYIPKKVDKKQTLVLVPPMQKRVLTKRLNPGVPVATDVWDPTRHYCENCACHYKGKGDLHKHQRFNVMHTEFDFVCHGCQKGFHMDHGVREHYYQEHKKEFLDFCTKCGKGFFHKSKKSNHKNACPKKDGEDKFPPRAAVDEELEQTFKRRMRVNLDTPQEVLDLAKQYAVEESSESTLATAALEKELTKDEPIEVEGDDDDDSQ